MGRVLVVAGDEQALAPYRPTQATLIVDDLDECQSLLARPARRCCAGRSRCRPAATSPPGCRAGSRSSTCSGTRPRLTRAALD